MSSPFIEPSRLLFLQPAVQPDWKTTRFPAPDLVAADDGGVAYAFESFRLGGVLLPGQWLLVEARREFGWEIRKGQGLSGATIVPTGDDLMTFKFAVRIWMSTQAGFYRSLLKTTLRKAVNSVPGTNSTAAMGIDQPQVVDMGVKAVVVKSVTPLMNPLVTSGGKGPWTAEVEFYEYRKPLPAPKTPTTVIPDVAPPTPTAQDNRDIENAALAKQFLHLAGGLVSALSSK